MAKELVANIYTDGTDWEHTIIAAHHDFLICNILVASVHMHTVKNVPRGKGKSANPNSHHVPHLLPDQKHKPTAAKLHYAALITALEIFFQAGKFPRNNCLSRAGGTKVSGEQMVPHKFSKAFPWQHLFWLHFQAEDSAQSWKDSSDTGLMGCYINRMCEHFLQLVKSCMGFHQW